MGKDPRTSNPSPSAFSSMSYCRPFARKKITHTDPRRLRKSSKGHQYKTNFHVLVSIIIKSFFCSEALVKRGLFQTFKAKSYQSILNKISLASRTFSKDAQGLSLVDFAQNLQTKQKCHILPREDRVYSDGILFFLLFLFWLVRIQAFYMFSCIQQWRGKQWHGIWLLFLLPVTWVDRPGLPSFP